MCVCVKSCPIGSFFPDESSGLWTKRPMAVQNPKKFEKQG